MMYDTCIFDLYGTLVDIRTDEAAPGLWKNLALFYSYYGASWKPEELKNAYERLTLSMSEGCRGLRGDSHEAFPEIRIEDVFRKLFHEKGTEADDALITHAGQFFRILSTRRLRLYEGTADMLSAVRSAGKKLYLLSNAQRIFTRYEMCSLGITSYFDGIYISSEHGYLPGGASAGRRPCAGAYGYETHIGDPYLLIFMYPSYSPGVK